MCLDVRFGVEGSQLLLVCHSFSANVYDENEYVSGL